MSSFKDHFSTQANEYVQYRPTYPDKLFTYLSTLTPQHDLAWDCGTGNGQSAISLTAHYNQVFATDPSEQQLQYATLHPRVTYKTEKAEQCSLPDHSVDLITIAQALHWFQFDVFYAEVRRVLKPKGIIAAWAYELPSISADIDRVLRHFHDNIVGPYWQYENKLIMKEYATIPFPFTEISPPSFSIQKSFSLHQLLGLAVSWSATQRFINDKGYNPVEGLKTELMHVWGDTEEVKTATWKLILKIGVL